MNKKFWLPVSALVALASGLVGTAGAQTAPPRPTSASGPLLDFHPSVPLDFQRFVGPTAVGRNVNVTRVAGAQSSTSVGVDPTNPNHILAGVNDWTSTAKVYESFDGSLTWRDSMLTPPPNCQDTWIDFNDRGTAFVAFTCTGDVTTLWTAFKRARERVWTLQQLPDAGRLTHLPHLVVDNESQFAGSVYIAYQEAAENNAAYVMYSRDGIGGWIRSQRINDLGMIAGISLENGGDGTLYAFWQDWQSGLLMMDKSLDAGATWGSDIVVHRYRSQTTAGRLYIPPQNLYGVTLVPWVHFWECLLPCIPWPIIVYTDIATTGGVSTQIYSRHSTDGGRTWSDEVKVNDDAISNGFYSFQPNIISGPNGVTAVTFYNTRNTPNNSRANRYISFTTNGGLTWGLSQRLSSSPSDETRPSADPHQYGDRQGLEVSDQTGIFYSAWTDGRLQGAINEDMFVNRARP